MNHEHILRDSSAMSTLACFAIGLIDYVNAIKEVRAVTGCSLKEAKDVVDVVRDRMIDTILKNWPSYVSRHPEFANIKR